VKLHGEIWNAECKDDEVRKGDEIEVVSIDNLKLIVKKRK
jgi:membrane protein implicated in regulation of membrane protease activity